MNVSTFEKWESEIRGYCRAYPTVFASASNARQVDEQGKSYIDFFAGAGVLNFGHNNEAMKRALIEFLEKDGVAHSLDMYTTVKRDFIDKFVATILEPRRMDMVLQFTGPTGTNAVEAALKLARKVTGRPAVAAFRHAFHGMTLGSLACTANPYFRQAAGVPLEHVVRLRHECDTDGEELTIDQYAERITGPGADLEPPAAFLIEVIQAEGGVFVASREWLQRVREVARSCGALFLIDEIQVGCGRTGSYFSFDEMDLDPDVVCLAKGVGGFGTPLAFNLIRREHDRWSPGEHTGTFRGQGFSFVAGRVGLSYFDDNQLVDTVHRHGEFLRERLEAIRQAHPDRNFEVRGKGMIQALDVRDGDLAKAIAARCFETGLLVGPCGEGGRVIKLIPPLTTPEADLREGMDLLAAAVGAVATGTAARRQNG